MIDLSHGYASKRALHADLDMLIAIQTTKVVNQNRMKMYNCVTFLYIAEISLQILATAANRNRMQQTKGFFEPNNDFEPFFLFNHVKYKIFIFKYDSSLTK